jgi:hypothetical protein
MSKLEVFSKDLENLLQKRGYKGSTLANEFLKKIILISKNQDIHPHEKNELDKENWDFVIGEILCIKK